MSRQSRHSLLLRGEIVQIAPASLAGRLFHLGDYPGLRLSDGGKVHGEYIRLRMLDDQLLKLLDEEEGPDYRRELVRVQLDSGETADAWAYLYVADVEGRAVIASGDWRLG